MLRRLIFQEKVFTKCRLCTKANAKGNELTDDNNKRVKESHRVRMYYLFKNNKKIGDIKEYIPESYLKRATKDTSDNLYLLCPDTAKKIANHVFPAIEQANHLICETNPGIGLVTRELLDKGVKFIRLCESSLHFQNYLNTNLDQTQIEIVPKDIFSLSYYAYRDKRDHGNRVETLLNSIQKRHWKDDPTMTIVGTMSNLSFIKYLIKSTALETGLMRLGRVQIFAVMRPRDYAVLAATPKDNLSAYRNLTVLFNTFFECDLLDTFPRKIFVPWQKRKLLPYYPYNLDTLHMYFVKITTKKDLPIPLDQALQFYYFILQLYGLQGVSRVIPTIESWVPNSGYDIIASKATSGEGQFEEMGVFTKFRELSPPQVVNVFKEMSNHPFYPGSPFMGMVEQKLMHSETIETDLHDALQDKDVKNLDTVLRQ